MSSGAAPAPADAGASGGVASLGNVGVMVYDSRSPFPVEEPPVALTERMRTALAGVYLAAKALAATNREMSEGAILAAKVLEEELGRYEAEMADWQEKLARKARELAQQSSPAVVESKQWMGVKQGDKL